MKFKLDLSKSFWSIITTLYDKIPNNDVVFQLYNCEAHSREIDFLDFVIKQNGVVLSFLPQGRVKSSDLNNFFCKGRQESGIAKGIRRILEYDVSESHIREFVEAINAEFSKNTFEIKIVSGNKMKPYYLNNNYIYAEGSELWKSCMRYQKCQDWMDLYTENPNLKLVVALQDNKVAARALLWNNIEISNIDQYNLDRLQPRWSIISTTKAVGKAQELVLLDRIYFASPQAKAVLWEWGTNNCDLLHTINKDRTQLFVPALGDITNVPIIQKFNKYKYLYYPFVDTMQFFNIETETFSNYKPISPKGAIQFNNSDGRFNRLTVETPSYDEIIRELQDRKAKIFLSQAESETLITAFEW